MHKTRNGVLGLAENKSVSPPHQTSARHQYGGDSGIQCLPFCANGQNVHRSALLDVLNSHMAQNNFPRTPPADRHQIANATAHHQPCRSILMAEITIGVENRPGKQPVSIFESNHLTAMKMPGQNQVIALLTGSFPDARVVRRELEHQHQVQMPRRDRTRQSRENRGLFGRHPHESIYRLRSLPRRERDACQHACRGCRPQQRLALPHKAHRPDGQAYLILLAHPPNRHPTATHLFRKSARIRLPADRESRNVSAADGCRSHTADGTHHADSTSAPRGCEERRSARSSAVLQAMLFSQPWAAPQLPSETILAKPIPTTNYRQSTLYNKAKVLSTGEWIGRVVTPPCVRISALLFRLFFEEFHNQSRRRFGVFVSFAVEVNDDRHAIFRFVRKQPGAQASP